ncbi:MAG: hypothetical protein QG657_3514, partial [Acidobacteriota bacterium]|nr:hypothetical protein [Acidobacteriota bacterium]
MKQKKRLLVVFLMLSFCVGSLSTFGNPQNSTTSGSVPPVEILEGMHPFYDA